MFRASTPCQSESGNRGLFVVSPNQNVNSQSSFSLWRRANARNVTSQPPAMANLLFPVPPDSVFYPDGPVFYLVLRIMDGNYSPNPEQKKLLHLFAYLFTLILKSKPYNLKVYFWKDLLEGSRYRISAWTIFWLLYHALMSINWKVPSVSFIVLKKGQTSKELTSTKVKWTRDKHA